MNSNDWQTAKAVSENEQEYFYIYRNFIYNIRGICDE